MKKVDLYDEVGDPIKLLTVAEVMRILRVGRRTLYEYNGIGTLLYFKLSARKIMYRQEDVERFLLDSNKSLYIKARGLEWIVKHHASL